MSEPTVSGNQQLQEVLQSKCFERATTLRALLHYLWENKDKEISEYAIAVEALNRNEDFESKIDATVRVQIWRLRRFLSKYYEMEGSQSTVRLTIPLGTHQIQVIEVAPGIEAGSHGGSEQGGVCATETTTGHSSILPVFRTFSKSKRFLLFTLGSIVAVALCVGEFVRPIIHDHAKAIAAPRDLPLFWKRFMNNGKPARIVLSAPVFFAWDSSGNNGFLVARDLSVNKFEKLKSSPQLVNIEKQRGQPVDWPVYTTASDTFASLHLTRFLDSYGVQSSVSSSVALPDEIIEHENVVIFGTTNSLMAYQADRNPMTFKLEPGDYIVDKSKPAGSAVEYPVVQESGSRVIFPGLIALLPHGNSGGRILVVQCTQTAALISYLTSESGMQEIMQAADRSHSSFFEAVILTEGTATTSIQSRLVAFRPVNPDLHASIR